MSKCKLCKGFNAGIGDYCPKCIQEARRIECIADNVPHKQALSHTNVPHKDKARPGMCSVCVVNVKAYWSHSYCRACYASKRKESRHTI